MGCLGNTAWYFVEEPTAAVLPLAGPEKSSVGGGGGGGGGVTRTRADSALVIIFLLTNGPAFLRKLKFPGMRDSRPPVSSSGSGHALKQLT